MPVTPFHFGPGAAVHALAPRQVSFLAFCAANVLIDVEPLYYMLSEQYPLHRFFHTYVGACLIVLATMAIFAAALLLARRFSLPNPFQWQQLRWLPIGLGAAAGAFSHIVLDSIMHDDIRPWAPFSDANALYGLISLAALHRACLLAALVGLVAMAIRTRWRGPADP
jgi:membrane-bound metal-dependent hydrolase YbcI (DUF457 family)